MTSFDLKVVENAASVNWIFPPKSCFYLSSTGSLQVFGFTVILSHLGEADWCLLPSPGVFPRVFLQDAGKLS